MEENLGDGALDPSSGTLVGLMEFHRTGLIAVGSAALISFISTSTLFIFLTYKLIMSHFSAWKKGGLKEVGISDIELELPSDYFRTRMISMRISDSQVNGSNNREDNIEPPRNPFPILIYNLLLAEMQTSLGYTLNIAWVVQDGIYVGTTTCWAQGLFNNFGVVASSIFFITISINTYVTVVWGWRPPQHFTQKWILFCWILALVLSFTGIAITNNGHDAGGWFVRASAWCWINSRYEAARLWSSWAWVLASIPLTIVLYTLTFSALFRDGRSSRHMPRKPTSNKDKNRPSGHHPAFLVYPFLYIACNIPLGIARLLSIHGSDPSLTYYCVAGLLLSTNGLWNTILWSTTMLISTPEDMHNTGLVEFAFMRTPASRKYGNMVWIQGPASKQQVPKRTGWWWWRIGGQSCRQYAHSRNPSQQATGKGMDAPVLDKCIHMDVITTVVEENIDAMTKTIHSTSNPQ